MTQGKRSLPGIAYLDFLANLLMLFLILFVLAFVQVRPKSSTPSIATLGYFAVVVSWQTGSKDDVDTYVEDPHDNIVNYLTPSVALMHLEQDDLGTGFSNTDQQVHIKTNQERVILSGVIAGEYTVDVMMFQNRDNAPQGRRVTVKLYRLAGADTPLLVKTVVLQGNGDVKTAFRFTLDANGHVTSTSALFKDIVYISRLTGDASSGPTYTSPTGVPNR